jgi:hypothetical protein
VGGGGDNNQPYKQQGQKLVGTGGTAATPSPDPYFIQQGYSIALSDDGSTLAVGGIQDNGSDGATWIFVRDGSGAFIQQGQKLVGSGGTGGMLQGTSVSLSADGSVLAVGGNLDDSGVGATWIFVRNQSGVLIQQGDKLVGTGGTGARQGQSVSLSADGLTLAVGGQYDNGNIGATWIFTSDGTDWVQQGDKLVGTGALGNQYQGASVALSADGSTLAVGGYATGANVGATWIFVKDEELGTWSQQGGPLQSNNATGSSTQGTSVALSDDGSVLAVGGPGNDASTGAAWVWTRTGTSWSENCFLVGTQADNKAQQGTSVSLSGDGSVLAVGGSANNFSTGATWIFKRIVDLDPRVGSSWYQEGEKMVGTGYRKTGENSSVQGRSVSLSGDGSVLAIGGNGDSATLGATWIFMAQE